MDDRRDLPGNGIIGRLTPEELRHQRDLEWERIRRDAASLAADARVARQVGYDEGFEVGYEAGLKQGEVIGRIYRLQQLLQQPEQSLPELRRLSEAELVQLEKSLTQQLKARKSSNGTSPNNPPTS